ncbi:MAG: protein arginine kinase, partial [Oscillospiraceae bacterium]|nr:protein arginine kinase [Oscillospiraceae bacterium]
NNIVISTRIRLARNLRGYPFVNRMSDEQKHRLVDEVMKAVAKIDLSSHPNISMIDMNMINKAEVYSLVEKHLISPNFAKSTGERVLFLSEDYGVSIMINEEDHIRIQVLSSGQSLEKALETANLIDNVLDENLEYAFDEKLGYLTECPTNLGTGLRASVMLHLPALEEAGVINTILNTVSKLGLTIRGTYGEGSRVVGSFYQISNQVTLGISEKSAIDNLNAIISQIIAQETSARQNLNGDALEDTVWRSLGILQNARLISSDELMNKVSNVLLGISMGIVEGVSDTTLIEIINETGSATLIAKEKADLSVAQRDKLRATYVRERLAN